MKIYTRGGDDGTTGLLGGLRVAKNDPRIASCGALDELNALLGVARAAGLPLEVDEVVCRIQHDLFALGAELASPAAAPRGIALIEVVDVERIELAIDRFDQRLPALRNFILPGGAPAAAALHTARSVCRRAERELVTFTQAAGVRSEALQYVNRVGDLLFVLARWCNAETGVADIAWEKRV